MPVSSNNIRQNCDPRRIFSRIAIRDDRERTLQAKLRTPEWNARCAEARELEFAGDAAAVMFLGDDWRKLEAKSR